MPTANYQVQVSYGDVVVQKNLAVTADGAQTHSVDLPVALAGALTTRTDDNTGELTVPDNTIETGDIVDVYWEGGVRYGMTVGSVVGDAVPIDGGAGDNLPADETNITVAVQVAGLTNLDGDEAVLVAIQLVYEGQDVGYGKGNLNLQDASDATIELLRLEGAVPRVWYIGGGSDNPFTGNPVTKFKASNGDVTRPAVLNIIIMADTTP